MWGSFWKRTDGSEGGTGIQNVGKDLDLKREVREKGKGEAGPGPLVPRLPVK